MMKNTKYITSLHNGKKIAAVIALLFCLVMVVFPELALNSTKEGMLLWASTVLPALLPFFICANFMIKLGLPKVMAKYFEYPIKKIFNVSGSAAFVFIMSITSGYPVGAKIIADLRKEKTITKYEAERMLTFCSTSGPLFMIGAVGIAMMNNIMAGWIIAISHYLGAIINGIFFRGHKSKSLSNFKMEEKNINNKKEKSTVGRFSLTEMLSDSMFSAFKSLGVICGYIIIFTLLLNSAEYFGFFELINSETIRGLIKGIVEITVGSNAVSKSETLSLIHQAILCSIIISFGGLSVIFQVSSMMNGTDIDIWFYIKSKICHGLWSGLIAFAIAPTVILVGMNERIFEASKGVVVALSANAYAKEFSLNSKNIADIFSTDNILLFFNRILFSAEMIVAVIIIIIFLLVSNKIIVFIQSALYNNDKQANE